MTTLNGWDLEAMGQAVEGVRSTPGAGELTWRSRVEWDGGFGLDVHTLGIEQLGEVMPRRFTLRGDHPPELLGQNTGPTAIETLLAALGACMAGTCAAQATGRGLELGSVEVDVAAKIDLNGFFGTSDTAPGICQVELAFQVDCEADQATLEEILAEARAHSPVHDSVTRPIAVHSVVSGPPPRDETQAERS